MIPEWNSFINADCMDYLKEFPDNYFDLALVDPPYGAGFTEGGGCKGWFSKYHQNAETPENLGVGGAQALEQVRSKVRQVQDIMRSECGNAGRTTKRCKRTSTEKNHIVGHCPWKRILRTTLSCLTKSNYMGR